LQRGIFPDEVLGNFFTFKQNQSLLNAPLVLQQSEGSQDGLTSGFLALAPLTTPPVELLGSG